jgi:3-hydroxymyristoyl/3-hydroxydecanoyl-(acyl carrier protein) dehydratase
MIISAHPIKSTHFPEEPVLPVTMAVRNGAEAVRKGIVNRE